MSKENSATSNSAHQGLKRVISWNINGIRAIVKKEGALHDIFTKLGGDIICFQETKMNKDDCEDQYRHVKGYESFWSFSKTKKGYSGVVTYVKEGFTINAKEGMDDFLDEEGRIIMTDHEHFIVLNVYFPNGGREGRADFKMEFYVAFRKYVEKLQKDKKVIILGDVNTAHKLLDIHQTKVGCFTIVKFCFYLVLQRLQIVAVFYLEKENGLIVY